MFWCSVSICFEMNTLVFLEDFLSLVGDVQIHIRWKFTSGKNDMFGSSCLTPKYLQNSARNKAFSTIICWCDQNYSVLKQNKILSIITARISNYSQAYSIPSFLSTWSASQSCLVWIHSGRDTNSITAMVWIPSWFSLTTPMVPSLSKTLIKYKDKHSFSLSCLSGQPVCFLCRKGKILPLQS